ncbi:Transcription activators,DNA binding,RNA polymerase II transcription factors,catalytics,transcription initiation factors isoform 4 [Theobroma cacao]|uniref:Transcription initiation factor IIF subunit alpha n=1 Tax=Theobroma cacao TaxID=3641 RepID=A0A061GI76_THECC|nr:Transcription activators,DNA binding,RNA polymerase II transcription factors,catalytics,transcription initiation factors isoform 4 [Theobroma cacao]
MSFDLMLKSSCSGCGSTVDLYGSNCKHMTLCVTCGKTMAENQGKCFECGAIVTRLIREYNVRPSPSTDKNFFIGRFMSGLPSFSKKKNAENKWSLQKEGLQGRQLTDPLKMKNRRKTADGYERWMMKAANNGAAAFGEVEKFDDKDNSVAGGKGRKKPTGDDDEGHVSDRGEEDEEEEAARKNRLGLDKKGGDDDEEGPRGGDLDMDDDDIEKGDDWEHEEIFTDDDEAVGNEPEERDLAPEVPAPPEIKEDEDEEDEEQEGGLSKSGKELKKLLGKAGGLNDSDADDDDDDDDDDDMSFNPAPASKQKDAPKEEPADNSPMKPASSASARGTSTASKSAKGKRKANGDDTKASNGTPLKKVKSETDSKSSVKEESASASKGSVPPKGTPSSAKAGSTSSAVTSSSAKAGSASTAGPVTEEEIRAVLLQKAPVTTSDLVAKFKARLKSPEDKKAFADILRRISKIQKTNGPNNYVVLRDK